MMQADKYYQILIDWLMALPGSAQARTSDGAQYGKPSN